MNRWQILTLLVPLVLLVFINVMPSNKGVMLYCESGPQLIYSVQETRGFPLTYLSTNRVSATCFQVNKISGKIDTSRTPTKFDKQAILPLGIVVDLVVAAAFIAVQTTLLKRQVATQGVPHE